MLATPLRQSPGLLLGIAALLPACRGCNETNIVTREPVAEADDEVVPPFTNDWGSWLSMAALPDGSPVVAFYDKTRSGVGLATGTFAEDGTLTWRHEEVDGYADENGLDPGDRGKYASLAVAADGTLWVAYQDSTNKALRYARKAPGEDAWTTGIADVGGGSSPDAGYHAAIALDASGNPVVAHHDVGKGHLRVARLNPATGSFAGVVVDEGLAPSPEVPASTGKFASIAVSSGVEYIAYHDVANGDLKLAVGGAGGYTTEVVDAGGEGGGNVGQWTDIVVEGSSVHISYHDVTNQDLKYAVGAPGSWALTTVDSGDHVGADTALFLQNGSPSIVYFDGRNNDAKVAWLASDVWQNRTVNDIPGALGFHNEVLSTNGRNYVACYDYTRRTVWFDTLD
jgi:hypothetical protein